MTANEKRIQTLMNNYNVTNVAFLTEVQEKRRKTFEDKKDIIVAYQDPRIHNVLGESLEIYHLNKTVADDWLNKYHPFGAPKGNVLSLGLISGDMIYCIMTFKKSRNKKYFAELSRLWSMPTYNVIGGYDILSSYASDELDIYNIVAYVNLSFENVNDYESIGMKYIRDIQPTKWWIKDGIRISDCSRRQSKKSREDMILSGFHSVFDLGIRVYEV